MPGKPAVSSRAWALLRPGSRRRAPGVGLQARGPRAAGAGHQGSGAPRAGLEGPGARGWGRLQGSGAPGSASRREHRCAQRTTSAAARWSKIFDQSSWGRNSRGFAGWANGPAGRAEWPFEDSDRDCRPVELGAIVQLDAGRPSGLLTLMLAARHAFRAFRAQWSQQVATYANLCCCKIYAPADDHGSRPASCASHSILAGLRQLRPFPG